MLTTWVDFSSWHLFMLVLSVAAGTFALDSTPEAVFNSNVDTRYSFQTDPVTLGELLLNPAPAVSTFPRSIWQTDPHPGTLPKKLDLNFDKYAHGWSRKVFNDSECMHFLALHFQPNVASLFHRLKQGAHKADLFRYAILYIHGGVYLDIKTELIAPLNWIFAEAHQKKSVFLVDSEATSKTIYNGVLAGPSRSPIFFEMIKFMVDRGKTDHNPAYLYSLHELHRRVEPCGLPLRPSRTPRLKKCEGTPPCSLQVNSTVGGNATHNMSIVFAREERRPAIECYDGPDRHGGCFFITHRCEKIFKVRYADYPFAH